jgi:hypothetical protein
VLDPHTTLLEVCELLAMLPHVQVQAEQLLPDSARIELIVGSGSSMHTLQRSCMGADVSLEPWIRLSLSEESATSIPSASCVLLASTLALDGIALGYLQLLGIHLVWSLHKSGSLPASAANRLLHQWKGVAVGA